MPANGRLVGSTPALSRMRSRRLLRLIEEQARHEALSPLEASGDPIVRAGRPMALVLRR